MISKGGDTWMAILSSDLTWSCEDDYLRSYLMQLVVLYSATVTRATMQRTKRDLEYAGYMVDLRQSYDSVISDIIEVNRKIGDFWPNSHGWAPKAAAELLAKSRLDWQVSLSHCLGLWREDPAEEDHDGCLILAWVNLGILVEGTMKFFLSVYERDYAEAPVTRGRRQESCAIDELKFEELKQFYVKNIWTNSQKKEWALWLGRIQQRRNAVHAYEDRDIGTFDEFFAEVATYLDFLMELEGQVPTL